MIVKMTVPNLIFHNGSYITPMEAYRRKQISMTLKGRKPQKRQCPHCGIICAHNMIARWHGDKCKKKVTTDE